MGEQTMMIFLKGGYKSQLSDYPPYNYIGISQLTEDMPMDVKSDGRSRNRFERSVAERNYCRGVETMRDTITFETGE